MTENDLMALLTMWDFDVKILAQEYPDTLRDEEVLAIAQEEGCHLVTVDRVFEKLINERGLPTLSVLFLDVLGGNVWGDD